MTLQSSCVRSCEKAMAKKRGQHCNKRKRRKLKRKIKEYQRAELARDRRSMCLIAGDEFAKKKKGPEYAFNVFESAELDYPSKGKKGDTRRCSRRIAKKKNDVTEMLSLRRGRS